MHLLQGSSQYNISLVISQMEGDISCVESGGCPNSEDRVGVQSDRVYEDTMVKWQNREIISSPNGSARISWKRVVEGNGKTNVDGEKVKTKRKVKERIKRKWATQDWSSSAKRSDGRM